MTAFGFRNKLIIIVQFYVYNKFSPVKKSKVYSPLLLFNNSRVQQVSIQKHQCISYEELTFKQPINKKIIKANKGIGVIHKVSNSLLRPSLLTIYNSFLRPHLESGDVIYNQPGNDYEGVLKKNNQQLAWNHSRVEDGKGACLSCVSFKLDNFEIYFFSAS